MSIIGGFQTPVKVSNGRTSTHPLQGGWHAMSGVIASEMTSMALTRRTGTSRKYGITSHTGSVVATVLAYVLCRFYRDCQKDLSLSLYLWLPDNPIRLGDTSFLDEPCGWCLSQDINRLSFTFEPTYTNMYPNVSALLHGHVAVLQPDILILNQGIWRSNVRSTPETLSAFLRAAKLSVKPGGRVIWKTTTAPRSGVAHRVDDESFIQMVRGNDVEIFDAFALTVATTDAPVRDAAFWDEFHYHPMVYRELNTALLDMLCLVHTGLNVPRWPPA
jgi:hypothetical protein